MLFEPTSVADIRYKCPVCLTALFPPVLQCQNGHLMCESCISWLKNCGVCRVSLPAIGRVRNLEVEKIIRIIQHPCPNEDDGCDAMVKFDKMDDHRLECNYTKYPISKKIIGHDCEEMTISEYAEHYKWAHGRNFFIVRRKALPITYTCRLQSEPRFFRPVFSFLFQGKPTLAIVTFSHNRETDSVTWKPYILAGKAVTDQLSCKISLLSGENVKIMTQSPIFNLQTEPEDLQACLSLPLKYLRTIFSSPSVNVNGANAGICRIRVELSKRVEIRPEAPRSECL